MIKTKKLGFFISSNGYGHIKRSLIVINEINKIDPNLHFLIFCNKSKLNYLQKSLNDYKLNIKTYTNIMSYEPNWLIPEDFNYEKYLKWVELIKNDKIISSCDLIVSDNYVTPLTLDNKTILMGSFLWQDVIKGGREVKKIRLFENKLINPKTEIIVLRGMFMDTLSSKLTTYEVPWFTERLKSKKKFYKNILITSGGTEQLDIIFLNIINLLLKERLEVNYFLDSKLFKKFNKSNYKNIKEFNFSKNDFMFIDLILCRPGIGILTDCISYSIPPVVVYDDSNDEIKNNAKKIAEKNLGVGIEIIDGNISENQIIKIKEIILSNTKKNKLIYNLLKEKVNGHKSAAKKIITELSN